VLSCPGEVAEDGALPSGIDDALRRRDWELNPAGIFGAHCSTCVAVALETSLAADSEESGFGVSRASCRGVDVTASVQHMLYLEGCPALLASVRVCVCVCRMRCCHEVGQLAMLLAFVMLPRHGRVLFCGN